MNEAAGSAARVYSLRGKSSVNLIIATPVLLCHHLLEHIGVVYLGPPYAVNTLLQRYSKQQTSEQLLPPAAETSDHGMVWMRF